MPRRRKRPPVPIRLSLPAEPPAPAEIDAILMATDAIISRAGPSTIPCKRGANGRYPIPKHNRGKQNEQCPTD
ncbi:MAG: hypothetical protein HF973_17370 [Chloroflexi bacterium]|nr:hypothetical protein [Chloroflexota bacterium]